MIAGLSKPVTLYVSPILALTAILLSVFTFLSPVIMLHDRVALLTVTPSTSLIEQSGGKVDGPSLFLGLLVTNKASVNCTSPALSPAYNLNVLPTNAPSTLLSTPPASTPVFVAVALGFSMSFFFTFTLISFRHKVGDRLGSALEKPLIQTVSAWIGFLGFFMGEETSMFISRTLRSCLNEGVTSFLMARIWFGKAVRDFNDSIVNGGAQAPKLVATLGNAFTS
ncbi:hypothetical protein H0H81_002457 [Sphagnurus paluster]|uniref:Uncharacterized protein n=1 Tax=Sphagnurus paluster TaxID=117069 RepID=A0A9P7GTY9_9AGAR|nr:hypothetical protein H0H81_002457 [Sphagnurus paluster]